MSHDWKQSSSLNLRIYGHFRQLSYLCFCTILFTTTQLLLGFNLNQTASLTFKNGARNNSRHDFFIHGQICRNNNDALTVKALD